MQGFLNPHQEKILCNLDEYGNTSAASIPLALDEVPVQTSPNVKTGASLLRRQLDIAMLCAAYL